MPRKSHKNEENTKTFSFSTQESFIECFDFFCSRYYGLDRTKLINFLIFREMYNFINNNNNLDKKEKKEIEEVLNNFFKNIKSKTFQRYVSEKIINKEVKGDFKK